MLIELVFLFVGVAGEDEEDVVEIGGMDRQFVDVDRFGVEAVEQGPQGPDTAVARELQGELVVVAGGRVRHPEGASGRFELARVGEPQADVTAGDEPLELVRSALGDQLPVVEERDPVGELVRLVQVLRRQEDGDAAGREVADDLPHRAPAARVQAGGRLVEEDDARVADQAHREVEATAHTAGVGGGGLRRRIDQAESLEQIARAPPALEATEVVEVGHEDQVLLAGEQVVDRRELAGDADRGADDVGSSGRIVARDPNLAGVGADQGREDVDDGGLAGAVGAEQREDRSLGDVEVDAVEHEVLAVGLAQAGRRDRRLRACHVILL